jgi:hypothetical protein
MLTIYTEPQANQIFKKSLQVQIKGGVAGMGEFWTSTGRGEQTALYADGAGPCLIIVVHAIDAGVGAIGHTPSEADPDSDVVVKKVQQMVSELRAASIDTILVVGGLGYLGEGHRKTLVRGCKSLYPNANIITDSNYDLIGACVYLPDQQEVGLFSFGLPGNKPYPVRHPAVREHSYKLS